MACTHRLSYVLSRAYYCQAFASKTRRAVSILDGGAGTTPLFVILPTGEAGFGVLYGNVGLAVKSAETYPLYAQRVSGGVILSTSQTQVRVNGNFSVVNGSQNFEIDHPLDPVGKVLRHNAVEGPDYITFYQGRVTLDANGVAEAVLPDYFEALNTSYHYQLTCIGGYAQVYVAEEVKGNRSRIAGGTPGRFHDPEGFGRPASMQIGLQQPIPAAPDN